MIPTPVVQSGIGGKHPDDVRCVRSKPKNGELFKKLFETDSFVLDLSGDRVGVEMCGTLKVYTLVGVSASPLFIC